MAVTFGTPVATNMTTTTSFQFVMTGVTSGQPIVVMRYAWDTGDPSSITDTFAGTYQWGIIDSQTFNGVRVQLIIGTEGSGTGGTITVNQSSSNAGGIAVACMGASTAHLGAAVATSGHNTGVGTTYTSPTLTPTATGQGAVYACAGTGNPTDPTAPWVTTDITTSGTRTAGIATYESPPAAPLTTSWSGGSLTWGTVGLIMIAAAVAPSDANLAPVIYGRGAC